MKIAFKNFLTTLKRYKVASLLNIAGLALAFAAFYIIMSQVYSSMTFNKAIKDNERVYMVSPYYEGFGRWSENVPNPICYETAAELPQVEAIASMNPFGDDVPVWIKSEGENYERNKMTVVRCTSSILDVFSFDIIAGNVDDFKQKDAVVLSQSAADAMGITIGSIIKLDEGDVKPGTPLTVVALFKDFPENTILAGREAFRNDNREYGMTNNNWNYSVFVKLRPGADPADYVALWSKKHYEFNQARYAEYVAATGREIDEKEREKMFNMPVRLMPMDESYFNTEYEYYSCGSWGVTMTMLAIALVIVVVAFINFVNFFMALVPVRMRSVNICKVFGAGQWTLRMNFFFEAVGLVLISLAVALCTVSLIDGSGVSEYTTYSRSIGENIVAVVLVLLIALVMAVVAAVYPAFYITRFNASMAVKKGFASSKAGRMLRAGLVAVQFIVSMVLMILALVFSMQYKYMIRYDVGIDRENLLVVETEDLATKHELFVERLAENPNIAAVTSTNWEIFASDGFNGRIIDGKEIRMQVHYVRHNAPEVLGIPVIMGNGFVKGTPGYLITDYTSQATGLGIGDKWDGEEIVGVIPHVNLVGANKAKVNTMLYSQGESNYRMYFYVRLNRNVDVEAVCRDICSIAKGIEPNAYDPEIEFVDDTIAKIYGDTKKQTVLISMFALIAVVISLMGVFGIVLFETQHRRSEIAVRKVYGATVGGVVAMFNRRYLSIIGICFVIAAPVAWIIADKWLQRFVNRIELELWLPFAVFAVVTVVSVLLVTLRSLKAATENPADVVKSN